MTETVFRLKRHLTSFQIMILGFAGVILLGALVLMLPIATVQRVWTPFHEALFTSTSAVCVTGLVVQDTGSYWSAFGQTVILLLIQIGGLGVITGAVTFLMLSGRNITLKERSAMQDAISAPAVGGIVRLTDEIYPQGDLSGRAAGRAGAAANLLPGLWTAGRMDVRFPFRFRLLQCGLRYSGADGFPLPLADGVCRRPAGQHRDHAADHRGRHRLSDVGRCLYARSAPAALPDAEQGHSECDGAFDHDSGGPLLSDGLCGPPRGRAGFGLALSGGHTADGRLQHG